MFNVTKHVRYNYAFMVIKHSKLKQPFYLNSDTYIEKINIYLMHLNL